MEWINDGVRADEDTGPATVVWWPAGTGSDQEGPRVVSQYVTVAEDGRYRVRSMTTFAAGEWEHEEPGASSSEAYPTRKLARAWARRMAEMEAANVHAVSWDGQVPA